MDFIAQLNLIITLLKNIQMDIIINLKTNNIKMDFNIKIISYLKNNMSLKNKNTFGRHN